MLFCLDRNKINNVLIPPPYTNTSNIYYLTGKTNLFMQHFINHLILTCSASPDFLSLAEVVNYEQTAQGSDHRHDVTDTDNS